MEDASCAEERIISGRTVPRLMTLGASQMGAEKRATIRPRVLTHITSGSRPGKMLDAQRQAHWRRDGRVPPAAEAEAVAAASEAAEERKSGLSRRMVIMMSTRMTTSLSWETKRSTND